MKEILVGLLVVGPIAAVFYGLYRRGYDMSFETVMKSVTILAISVTGVFFLYFVGFFVLAMFGDRRASEYNGCGD